jgi:hypothetical protein
MTHNQVHQAVQTVQNAARQAVQNPEQSGNQLQHAADQLKQAYEAAQQTAEQVVLLQIEDAQNAVGQEKNAVQQKNKNLKQPKNPLMKHFVLASKFKISLRNQKQVATQPVFVVCPTYFRLFHLLPRSNRPDGINLTRVSISQESNKPTLTGNRQKITKYLVIEKLGLLS